LELALLSASDVSFAYRGGRGRRQPAHPAVRNATMQVPAGAIVGILGPNGSGKTTLLKLLAGVLRPDSGTIHLDDHDLRSMPRSALATRLAMVPQETHPAFDYTVLEMVLMGRYAHLGAFELEGPNDLRVARECMEATGTSLLEDRYFHTLSGGEKQRVAIASALAQATDLMLLDEPSSSLDLRYQLEVADLLQRLNRQRGATLVLSTHDLNFAASICDSLLLIREGSVLASGPPRDVLTSDHIRALYGVEADVQEHPRAGHLTVVPIRPAGDSDESPPRWVH
jgi:iron complex transport system ATP-binding protein